MIKRHLWALPILLPTLAMACLPSARKFSDDDDDGGGDTFSVGSSNNTSGTASNGAGGNTAGAGGAGSTTNGAVTGATTGTTAANTAATTTGGGNGICNSGLTSGSDDYDGCLSASCCSSFNNCLNDAACSACLDGSGSNCESNSLLNAWDSCSSSACPGEMCGSGIGFTDGNGAPAFNCNQCGTNNCCGSLNTCVQGGSQTEIETCLDCVNGDAACSSAPAAVQTAADDFNACIGSACSLECG